VWCKSVVQECGARKECKSVVQERVPLFSLARVGLRLQECVCVRVCKKVFFLVQYLCPFFARIYDSAVFICEIHGLAWHTAVPLVCCIMG
jgi:hypothetical protein